MDFKIGQVGKNLKLQTLKFYLAFNQQILWAFQRSAHLISYARLRDVFISINNNFCFHRTAACKRWNPVDSCVDCSRFQIRNKVVNGEV